MKRWTRSLPFLLAWPASILLSILASHFAPTSRELVAGVSALLTIALFYGQMSYLSFRDKEAIDAFSGPAMLFFGVGLFLLECLQTPYSFSHLASGRALLMLHSTIGVMIVGGGAIVLGAIKGVQPKDWWTAFQAWQRKPLAIA